MSRTGMKKMLVAGVAIFGLCCVPPRRTPGGGGALPRPITVAGIAAARSVYVAAYYCRLRMVAVVSHPHELAAGCSGYVRLRFVACGCVLRLRLLLDSRCSCCGMAATTWGRP